MFEILSLFRSDYSVKLHIREIARLLKTNHRTILMNLQKLEEANIFHSEIIGKNKLYYLNINNITTREYIRSAEIVKTIAFLEKHFVFKKFIDEVLSKIESFPIIIFGSYAKGQEKKDSDVDVFIFSDHYQYNKEVAFQDGKNAIHRAKCLGRHRHNSFCKRYREIRYAN